MLLGGLLGVLGCTETNVVLHDSCVLVQVEALVFLSPGENLVPPDAPDAPTPTFITSNSITLSLPESAATDHAGYRVHRSLDGSSYAERSVGLITEATWQDTDLSSLTTYWYALVDQDTSSNRSDLGASVSQETL